MGIELIFSVTLIVLFLIPTATTIAHQVKLMYWHSRLKHSVIVKWPTGYVDVGPNSREWNGVTGECRQVVWSADPNDHYRPWLEENVGLQRRDWDWDIHIDEIIISFRTGKEQWAMQAALMWN